MKGSVKDKGKGGMSPPPSSTTRATGGSESNNTIDEDWSIISSSSDFDDDRSTTSSDGKHNIGLDEQLESLDAGSSVFKVPRLVPGFDKQGQVESTPDTGKSSRVVNDEIDNSPLSFSLVSRLDDSGSDSLSHSISVGSKIKFFENMSLFNESIKQKSSDFYSNYAKDKIDQLNRYVSEQNKSVGLDCELEHSNEEAIRGQQVEDISSSVTAEIDTDLEDTIELQANEKQEIKESPKEKLAPNHPNVKSSETKRATDSLKVRVVRFTQDFLDSHSEYLCYYLFALLIGLVPAVYAMYHFVSVKESKPVTMYDKLNYYWDNIVYEEAPATSNFFQFHSKKSKVNRFVNYGKQVRAKWGPGLTSAREWTNKAFEEVGPIANSWLGRTQDALKIVNANTKRWFKESRGFVKAECGVLKDLALQGSDIASTYGKLGFDYATLNGKIFAGRLSQYTAKSVTKLDSWLHSSSAQAVIMLDKSARLSAKHGKTASRLLRKHGRKLVKAGRYGLRKSGRVTRKSLQNLVKQYPGWRKSVGLQLANCSKWGALFWSKDSVLGKQIHTLSRLVFKKFSEFANVYRGISNEKGLEVL